jgi:hypothetical protein
VKNFTEVEDELIVILGPVLFNIFINDIFYFISDSSLYNYADDNTLSYSGYDLEKI